MAAKARAYLDGDARHVWVVWPDRQQVEVWHAGRSVGPIAVLTVDEVLDGEDVVPGFTHPVAAVFADPLA